MAHKLSHENLIRSFILPRAMFLFKCIYCFRLIIMFIVKSTNFVRNLRTHFAM